MVTIMKLSRSFFFPLLLALTLLFAQQAGVAHSLHHDLEDLMQQQDDKQAPHSDSCEKCADYVHLGSSLSVGSYDFIPLVVSDEAIHHSIIAVCITPVLAATARGPPAHLQRIA
jgi:hypothetical protein